MTTRFELRDEGSFVSLYEDKGTDGGIVKVLSGTAAEMFDMFAMVKVCMTDIAEIEDVTLQDSLEYPLGEGRFAIEANHVCRDVWLIEILERKPQTQIYQNGRGFGYSLWSDRAEEFMDSFVSYVTEEASA